MEKIEDVLTTPIQLTDTLRKLANEADSYRQECGELKLKADAIAHLLRTVARGCNNDGGGGNSLYIRPMRRIMQELEKSLGKVIILIRKCHHNNIIKRVITITSVNDFKKAQHLLDNATADITWLLSISGFGAVGGNKLELHGLPPIASSEPMMSLFWEQIVLLERGNEDQKEDAANSLGLLARDNDKLARIIVEEGAVVPMLKVLGEGNPKVREAAAKGLEYMAKDSNTVKQMVLDGVAPAFVKVLTGAPMNVQIAVASALAVIVTIDPEQQDTFMEHLAIRPLVALLGESLEELNQMKQAEAIQKLKTSVFATRAQNSDPLVSHVAKPVDKLSGKLAIPAGATPTGHGRYPRPVLADFDHGRGISHREMNRRERDNESPEVKAELKAQVARALCALARGNFNTSKSITETKALLCFATLMEKGKGEVRLNSILAVMEIAAVAEKHVELRRSAFKMSSPAAKAVVEQLLCLVDDNNPDYQIPCIKAIGCLARTFPVRETRVVKPLVKQLESTEPVAAEAVIALEKFACTENFLHTEHSQAIVEASGAPHLVQLIYFGEGQAQVSAVTLMCYLALHVGESEALAKAEPLPALKAFTKNPILAHCPMLERLLTQAITRLQIFQEKGIKDDYDPFNNYD